MNVAGTFLLFYSFQATSSDFRLVTAKSYSVVAGEIKQYALCVNNYTLLETDSRHGIMVGSANCPDWQHARPAAVVNIEHPSFLTIGFSLLFFGFIIQFFAVPEPKTIAELRYQIKMLKIREKAREEQDRAT
jgi:hypothetical protein